MTPLGLNLDPLRAFCVVQQNLVFGLGANHLLVFVRGPRGGWFVLAVVETTENYREVHIALNERYQNFVANLGDEESTVIIPRVKLLDATPFGRHLIVEPRELHLRPALFR